MWRDFSHLLAPLITKLFNRSLQEQSVPCHWKLANVTPIPKESPLTNCNQLRPISLTNIIITLFEKLILKFEMFHVLKSLIGPDQFAYNENSNTTMALVKSQHYWLKWLDGNADFVRVLSFDFSKAFVTVSHYILSDKLKAKDINLLSPTHNRFQVLSVRPGSIAWYYVPRKPLLLGPSCRYTNGQGKQSPIHIEGLQVLWLFSRSTKQVI